MGVSVQVEHALALHKFNGAAAEVIAALRDVESKASSTEEPADTDAAEALLRQHETVKAELETSGRRLAAVEVGVRVQCSVCIRPDSCFCVCVCAIIRRRARRLLRRVTLRATKCVPSLRRPRQRTTRRPRRGTRASATYAHTGLFHCVGV
jgi:hypothetical protein